MKSHVLTAATARKAVCMLGAVALCAGLAAWGVSASVATEAAAPDAAAPEAEAGMSLVQVHEAAGIDISSLEGAVTYAACEPCHGDYLTVRAATEAMWPGIGQITDANPHTAHATNAFECSDCHKVDGPQVNVCNQCHDFDSPEGWVDMASTTTVYGNTGTQFPLFRTEWLNG